MSYTRDSYCVCTVVENDGLQHKRYIHRLIYETWVETIPELTEINHKNGKKYICSLGEDY
jgi:hypothetical protein